MLKAHTATATRAAIQAAHQHRRATEAANLYPTIAPNAPAKWAAALVEDKHVPHIRTGAFYITTTDSIGFRPARAIEATTSAAHQRRTAQVCAQALILHDASNHSRKSKRAINAYLRAKVREVIKPNMG